MDGDKYLSSQFPGVPTIPEQRMMMLVVRELPAQKLPPLAGHTKELVALLLLMGQWSVNGLGSGEELIYFAMEVLQADLRTSKPYRCC